MGAWPLKYMGSKRRMLSNGLGDLIVKASRSAGRIVDLMCGSGVVAWYCAENTELPVLAADLQSYAATLSDSVISRTEALDADSVQSAWHDVALRARDRSKLWSKALKLERAKLSVKARVAQSRQLCARSGPAGVTWRAYGGYYFSPAQALTVDHLLTHLPPKKPSRTVCLASLIVAASKCVASPGHTAQPFRPTETAGKYIIEAWQRDVASYSKEALQDLAARHARVAGGTRVADAIELARELRADDLVMVDPPYSGVQYSRFYHVLEAIARGSIGTVEGAGRYPNLAERPQSDFSKKTTSRKAVDQLLAALGDAGATVLLTYPTRMCSNGLSGSYVRSAAKKRFRVERQIVRGRFSTLGGNNTRRSARKASSELILILTPKKGT